MAAATCRRADWWVLGGWAVAQLWLFWLAPIVGGALGAAIYRVIGREQR